MPEQMSPQLLIMSGVEEVDRSLAWMAVEELQGMLPALQQVCQQAVGWDEMQPVVEQATRDFNQVNWLLNRGHTFKQWYNSG